MGSNERGEYCSSVFCSDLDRMNRDINYQLSNPAEFHPDPKRNGGVLGALEQGLRGLPQQQQDEWVWGGVQNSCKIRKTDRQYNKYIEYR